MSDSTQSKPSDRPTAPAAKSDEAMREVLTKLLESANHISESDKQLGLKIRDLGVTAKDPGQLSQTPVQVAIAAAAQDYERATGRQLDLSPAQRAEVTRLTAPAAATAPDATSAPKNDGATKAATQSPADPIRDALTKLVAGLDQLPAAAKDLSTKIRALDKDAQDPVRFNQKSVQYDVAYAVQDFEKATGKQLDLAPAQRAEVTKLAGSAPGLENDRMIALLRSTAQIGDNAVIDQIRRFGSEVGQKNNQNTAEIQSRVDNLENKVRQAPRAAEPASQARGADASAQAEQTGASPAGNGASNGTRSDQRQTNDPESRSARNNANIQEPLARQSAVLRGGVLDTLAAALRGNGNPDNAPWDPQATPFGDRVRAFQARVDARDQDRVIGRVEHSARAAVDALDGFRNTEGAAVMNRIQSAARAEPGGMATVLSEMREGGRFSDLRQAFNTALNDDKGFAQAYDKAATALARYGQGREQVEQIIAKRPDAANLTAKFEQLDSQVGERASNTPSRNEGKNMLDDISKTVAEIIQNATDKVRGMFSRAPTASASPAPAA
ncbi:MAG: hypothetical protein B7Z77_04175 [Acidocella sp. 20-58-15]|nr:MAG: hypothetical protein B7Z77_04175 [Acidocella sp. 20-58-15]